MMPSKESPNHNIVPSEEKAQLRLRTRLLLNLAGVLFIISLILPLWGDEFEHAISDVFFRVRGPLIRPSDIVLVGIDDDSFQYFKLQWPWPRRLHAELIDSLTAMRARTIVFDVLFGNIRKAVHHRLNVWEYNQ